MESAEAEEESHGLWQVHSPVLKPDIVADLTCGCGWGIQDKTYKLRFALGISWSVDNAPPHVWIVMKFMLELNSLLSKAGHFCNPNKNDCFEFGCLHGWVTLISNVENFI